MNYSKGERLIEIEQSANVAFKKVERLSYVIGNANDIKALKHAVNGMISSLSYLSLHMVHSYAKPQRRVGRFVFVSK